MRTTNLCRGRSFLAKLREVSNSLKALENKEKAAILQAAVCIGEQRNNELARKSVINLNFFLAHREEILAMKEQVQMIKELLVA